MGERRHCFCRHKNFGHVEGGWSGQHKTWEGGGEGGGLRWPGWCIIAGILLRNELVN